MTESISPKVFISYSHDSTEHSNRVCALANQLRSDGIDCHIDQFENPPSPPEGWPLWMERQIAKANFVLVVCTATYLRRFTGQEQPAVGHGVSWESLLTANHIYAAGSMNTKCIPVLFNDGKAEDVPRPLQGATRYWIERPDDYEWLYRHLTNQPSVRKSELGSVRTLPPREPNPNFFTNAAPDRGATTTNRSTTPTDRRRGTSNQPNLSHDQPLNESEPRKKLSRVKREIRKLTRKLQELENELEQTPPSQNSQDTTVRFPNNVRSRNTKIQNLKIEIERLIEQREYLEEKILTQKGGRKDERALDEMYTIAEEYLYNARSEENKEHPDIRKIQDLRQRAKQLLLICIEHGLVRPRIFYLIAKIFDLEGDEIDAFEYYSVSIKLCEHAKKSSPITKEILKQAYSARIKLCERLSNADFHAQIRDSDKRKLASLTNSLEE